MYESSGYVVDDEMDQDVIGRQRRDGVMSWIELEAR